jgi:PST family polysaccharide transporter
MSMQRHTLARNLGALFGGHAVGLVVPLLVVPYLARVLRPEGWAPVLVAQALAAWLILLMEFGFDLSATRAVAQTRATPESLPNVVLGVQSAKLFLVPVTCAACALAILALPTLRAEPWLLGSTLSYALLRGLNPFWYFQGQERLRRAAVVEATTKALAALACFLVVRAPADGWRVVALQAVFSGISLAILTMWMMREVPMRRPSIPLARGALSDSVRLFAFRASAGLYTQANALILTTLASATTVAYFGGAERVVRAAVNLLQPLTQALFPRLSFLTAADPSAAQRAVVRSLAGIGSFAGVLALATAFGAPLLVRVLLGPGYDAAIPVLRALSPLPLLVGVGTVLGLYWAIPFGFERAFLAIVLAAGLANLALALLLAPRFGALGMAAAVVLSEGLVATALAVLYLRRRARGAVIPRTVLT